MGKLNRAYQLKRRSVEEGMIKACLKDDHKEEDGVHLMKSGHNSSKGDVNETDVRGSNPDDKPRRSYLKTPVKLNIAYQLRAKNGVEEGVHAMKSVHSSSKWDVNGTDVRGSNPDD